MLAEDELTELAADIKEHGLFQPIVLDAEGRVLDGRNRLAACKLAGVEPVFETFSGDDPDGFALAVNIARRHLTTGARAIIAAQAARASNAPRMTGDALAESANLHRTRVINAGVVPDYAPALIAPTISGSLPLKDAYESALQAKKARFRSGRTPCT